MKLKIIVPTQRRRRDGSVRPFVVLKYDGLNRLTNMVDAVGTTKYAYKSGGELFTEDGPFASDTVTNVYNNRLRTRLGLQLALPRFGGQVLGNWGENRHSKI